MEKSVQITNHYEGKEFVTSVDLPERAQAILDFWFGEPGSAEFGTEREVWFYQDDAFDDQIRGQFLEDYQRAAIGDLDSWGESRDGALALIILLDQIP